MTGQAQALFHHKLAILEACGIAIPKTAVILDYGCGAGETVSAIANLGFNSAYGFDIVDYLAPDADKRWFRFDESGHLPFPDAFFDLVISEQVFEHVYDQQRAWSEIARVLKPGGSSIHVFPGRWRVVEPHMYVPFGGVVGRYWYYWLWAIFGIRNEFQQGLNARETALRNVKYFQSGLNYVSTSSLRQTWARAGLIGRFCEREYLMTSSRAALRAAEPVARAFWPFRYLLREGWSKIVVVRKPMSNSAVAAPHDDSKEPA